MVKVGLKESRISLGPSNLISRHTTRDLQNEVAIVVNVCQNMEERVKVRIARAERHGRPATNSVLQMDATYA